MRLQNWSVHTGGFYTSLLASRTEYVSVTICLFSHWPEPFSYRPATASSVVKILFGKNIPTWVTPLKLHSDGETHFSGQVPRQIRAAWAGLGHFHCAAYPQSLGSAKHSNGTMKIQLAKSVQTFQTPWLKALPSVLLNPRSTPLGTCRLSPFKVVTGHLMYLAPASSDPQLTKRDTFQYFKGLIASIKNNHTLVRGARLAQSVERLTLDLVIVSSSPMLAAEIA